MPTGEAAFEFEVLDRLTPPDDPSQDMSDDLETLHDLWREKLQVETGLTY